MAVIRKAAAAMVLAAGVLLSPGDVESCGPFFPRPIFTFQSRPERPDAFARGELGVVRPGYRRVWLLAAYRTLSGLEGNSALLPAPQTEGARGVHVWLAARKTVPGASPIGYIDPHRAFTRPGSMVYYVNCTVDAFETAARTLDERVKDFGPESQVVREWLAGQDQVFANCSGDRLGGAAIPGAAQDPKLTADRAYQVAAARFYAGDFDGAGRDFRAIAADASSPWRSAAPYLEARALIRKGTLEDASALPAAVEQLERVIADPDLGRWHESARGLIRYIRAREDPEAALRETARVVSGPDPPAGDVADYLALLDRFERDSRAIPRQEDVTDWLLSLRAGDGARALERWRATQRLPWLVAALATAKTPESDLLEAAAKLDCNSPAWLTATYHAARLMPPDEARPVLDGLLSLDGLPVSERNLFLAARMKAARDQGEFLRYAQRVPAGEGYYELPEESPPGMRLTEIPGPFFDRDATDILNRQEPEELAKAAVASGLPGRLRRDLAAAAWVRGVLRGRGEASRRAAPVLARAHPEMKPLLDAWAAAPDEAARRFAAVFLMLRFPGLSPHVSPGFARITPAGRIDSYRFNWWCGAEGVQPAPDYLAGEAIQWAERNPSDPRSPEALHLAVRATRYGCKADETGRYSERAFRLLHARYPRSEWARRTPYWFE